MHGIKLLLREDMFGHPLTGILLYLYVNPDGAIRQCNRYNIPGMREVELEMPVKDKIRLLPLPKTDLHILQFDAHRIEQRMPEEQSCCQGETLPLGGDHTVHLLNAPKREHAECALPPCIKLCFIDFVDI